MISISERDFITKGVDCNIRADGRGRGDFRELLLETGMITQASGSCQVKLEGGTDVLVGVKVEVGSIEPDVAVEEDDVLTGENDQLGEEGLHTGNERDCGRISCHVECSPSVTRAIDSRDVENMCNEYGQFLNRVLNGPQGGLNLKSLCIIPGSTCWILNIDVLVLDYGGNLLDAIFMATRGAIHNTRIPKATVTQSDGRVEFDIADEETEILQGREDAPLVVSLNKIGYRHIVDATPLEEQCSSAVLAIAVNRRGNLCALQKGGHGGIEPSLLSEMVQVGY
ncbi:ribosomal protein S5 domain 2-type protein [Phlyctochytrium arcticum]|nr:ribosomal protein S5 domain 2-type protein [Phlyctochytrium arcticum]